MAPNAPNTGGWLSAIPGWLKFGFVVGVLGVLFGAWSVQEFGHAIGVTFTTIKDVIVIVFQGLKQGISEAQNSSTPTT